MWNLSSDQNGKRIYVNSTTGSKCTTSKVYTDKEGNDWYTFEDLMAMPYTRQQASSKITSLYLLGFTKEDLNNHIAALKSILRSTDNEKYDKAMSLVLDFEAKANMATDTVKQISALVPVYFMFEDEDIDSFVNSIQIKKMSLLEADGDMHNFFLNLATNLIEDYMAHLKLISEIASPQTDVLQEVLV